MEGPDHNDSHCIDFKNMSNIRDLDKITNPELHRPGVLKGLRVGVLDEFNIKELDDRNRNIQEIIIQQL
jgi:hypothetical protein